MPAAGVIWHDERGPCTAQTSRIIGILIFNAVSNPEIESHLILIKPGSFISTKSNNWEVKPPLCNCYWSYVTGLEHEKWLCLFLPRSSAVHTSLVPEHPGSVCFVEQEGLLTLVESCWECRSCHLLGGSVNSRCSSPGSLAPPATLLMLLFQR